MPTRIEFGDSNRGRRPPSGTVYSPQRQSSCVALKGQRDCDWLQSRKTCVERVFQQPASLGVWIDASETRSRRAPGMLLDADVRILPPQPASPVSTRQLANAAQNRAAPRHFADMTRSPCAELGHGSTISGPCLRGLFLVSRFSRNIEVARRLSRRSSPFRQPRSHLSLREKSINARSISPTPTSTLA